MKKNFQGPEDRNRSPGRKCSFLHPTFGCHSNQPGPSFPMAKRSLSPVHLPPSKRAHLIAPSPSTFLPPAQSNTFECLYDELILHIFTFLSYTDLCTLQATNRNLARLSLDNQVHSTFISGTPFFCAVTLNIRDCLFLSCSYGRTYTCMSLADSA